MTLLLSGAELSRILRAEAVIAAVETGFVAYSAGHTVTPLRVGAEPPGVDGVLLVMPCAVSEPPALGAKVVGVFRGNAGRGLPTVTSLYLLADYDTGAPLAVMDGTYLTATRTAAGSAVATRLLARADARTLGVFGTGVQARFHVKMICAVRAIQEILVAGTSQQKAEEFARWAAEETSCVTRAASHAEVAGADILAVATTSATPVVPAGAARAGCHVNAVGAFTPTTRELPTELVRRSRVFVDSRAGAFAEAGDLLIPVQEGAYSTQQVAGEIGEVALGMVAGRTTDGETTVYKSVGAAFLDAVTARLAYEEALACGTGMPFQFS